MYAHMYHSHFTSVVSLGEEAHLNTSFKHFIFYVEVCLLLLFQLSFPVLLTTLFSFLVAQEFKLVDPKELAPMAELIESFEKKEREREAVAAASARS